MAKQLTFIFFIGFCIQLQAQINRKPILGTISNDSISVEAIHIYNKNTHKGTISNKYGIFKIPVKENDTLVFDGIQFQKREIVITNQMLKTKIFDITLNQNINKLASIEIKKNHLSGDLNTDAKQVKKPPSFVGNAALNFSNIDFNAIDNIDATDRQKPPDPFANTNAQVRVGGNLLGLLGFVLNPLLNEVGKIGQRKRRLKHTKKAYQTKVLSVPDKIRTEFGDAFFVNRLKIPRNKINAFIIFCQQKDIANLYLNNHKIELIEVLMTESKSFKALKN